MLLGAGSGVALALARALGPAAIVTGFTAGYAGLLWFTARKPGDRWAKARLVLSYAFTACFYESVGWICPAVSARTYDGLLVSLDRRLFGETPAVFAAAHLSAPWLVELMSAAYLSYQIVLQSSLLGALFGPIERARRLYGPVFTTFAVGFAGYVLLPAVGPDAANPGLFSPLVGGPVTALNAWVVSFGSPRFDVFPSLHVAITLVLVDETRPPLRWVLAVLASLVVASTIVLHYHYAVDLIGGTLLFAAVRVAFGERAFPMAHREAV